MIRIIESGDVAEFIKQRGNDYTGVNAAAVEAILADIKSEGDAAVRRYTAKFDGYDASAGLEVSRAEIDEAFASVDSEFIKTLKIAADNIAYFHKHQLRDGFTLNKEDGTVLGQKYTPIAKAGIYVPGGTAAYPSTVLMNAIPARIAGVKELIMATPPGKDGKVKPEILAAASIAGVDRVFRIGGAQAIGALAYGTETVPSVDKIVGPGNIFVALAKRAVSGTVGIDMIAGPSEILIIADNTAIPSCVAADLLSQAEHDKLAAPMLITIDRSFAEKVSDELERRLALLPRKDIARASVDSHGVIIVAESIDECIKISNEIAPEHLELCVEDCFAALEKVTNAGSVFLGNNTPEPLGDYIAGTNHTIPTGGSARFSSPLSVDDFRKKTSFLFYTEKGLAKIGERTADFARREGLDAHALAISARFENKEETGGR